MDPKTAEIGLVADAACQRVAAAVSSTGLLMWHSSVTSGDLVEEDHFRGGLIELRFLMEKGVITVERRAGKTYLLVKDPDAWHNAVGELLAEHQRIRATGDKAAIKALVEKWGTKLHTSWRDEVLARLNALSLPAVTAFLPPILSPVRDGQGQAIDATATQAGSSDEYIATLEAAWAE